jgi:hypothetical protein
MKVLNLTLLLLLLAGVASAQTSQRYPEAPGVVIAKSRWHTKVLMSRTVPAQDPMQPSVDRINQENAINERQEELLRSGATGQPDPMRSAVIDQPSFLPGRTGYPVVAYIFEGTILNTGTKKIRRLIWEYIFLDASGTRELGYRAFASEVNVKPGKSAKVAGYVSQYANNTAAAKKANQAAQQLRGKYLEILSVRRIEYADNSFWQRPSK